MIVSVNLEAAATSGGGSALGLSGASLAELSSRLVLLTQVPFFASLAPITFVCMRVCLHPSALDPIVGPQAWLSLDSMGSIGPLKGANGH